MHKYHGRLNPILVYMLNIPETTQKHKLVYML